MAAIYLRHAVHGTKVACGDAEAAADCANGWQRFTVDSPKAVEPVALPVVNALVSNQPAPKSLHDLSDNELREMYEQKTGTRAHHRLSRQSLIGKISAYGDFSERAY